MEMIFSWVKSGLLFGIFASVILMLSPNKSYMKHISLVVGMLFILVMIHPVMELLNLDGRTYASYIENLLMHENTQDEMTQEHIALYEESVNIQLMAALKENGYDVKEVFVDADEMGNVSEVHISFNGAVTGLENIELYLINLFGQEVDIYYENG